VLQFSVTWEEELLDLVLWMVAKNPDIKKIGVIELDVPYIRAIVDKTLGSKAEKLLGEMGVELMKPERMGLMALDATPQMIKMKRAKPDAIVLAMAMHAPPIVAKAASAVKMKIGKDCVFLVPYVGFDHSLLLSLKDGGLLTEGWYGSIMSPSPDQPEITGVKEVMEVAKGYGRRARRDAGVIYITTFAMHMLHPETVGMALDELGGWENWEERLTPELIRKQYLKMNDYRSIFDVRTFTFLPGKVTCQGNLIGTIQGEDMVQASDWHWAPNLSTIFSMERWEDPPMEVILKDYPQASLHWLLSTYLPWEEKPEESLTAVAKFWSEYRDTGEVKIGEYTLDLYEPLPEGTSLEEAKAILKVAQERYL
jgi:hypothetical protein